MSAHIFVCKGITEVGENKEELNTYVVYWIYASGYQRWRECVFGDVEMMREEGVSGWWANMLLGWTLEIILCRVRR